MFLIYFSSTRKVIFFKSTNEDPRKIPNLFSFSPEYRRLQSSRDVKYLTTPVILPFPEKEPHKFLIVWNGQFFIEVGFKIKEIAKTLENILTQDPNIMQIDLAIGDQLYSIAGKNNLSKDNLKIEKSVSVHNQAFAQSLSDDNHTYRMIFHISKGELKSTILGVQTTYFVNFILTLSLITFLLFLATKLLRKRMKSITQQIAKMAEDKDFSRDLESLSNNKDFNSLVKSINTLLSSYRDSSEQVIQTEKDLVYKNMAFQVAHDIRSPLEALKASKEELMQLPQEDKRNILMAINRIEEIAYNLLKTRKNELVQITATHLVSQLEQILIEKKLQYRNYDQLEICSNIDASTYSSFTNMKAETFKRIISNLVTNSAEALNFEGTITISTRACSGCTEVSVVDTGPGIPELYMNKIFSKGFTTKLNGNGLGLHNAIIEMKHIGGSIEATCNHGTLLSLKFPFHAPPSNFIPSINLQAIERIIVLDDDEGIHRIWDKRLKTFQIDIEHFNTAQSLLIAYHTLPPKTLLLTDYELLGEHVNGLDCIQKLGVPLNSILVTARHEEEAIQTKTLELGIKLLPKSMVSMIPILTNKFPKEIILIDDDELCHLSWKRKGTKVGISVHSYLTITDFLANSHNYNKTIAIYIDSNLGNGIKGEVESEYIYRLGFGNLYLSTGYLKHDIEKPLWIRDVFSKNFEEIDITF